MPGASEEPSDSAFRQFRLSCVVVLWGGRVLFDFECCRRAYTLTIGESRFCNIVHLNENLRFEIRWDAIGFAH